MTQDDEWTYSWNAENRLTAMQSRTDLVSSGIIAPADAIWLEFKYDYLGRRAEKLVHSGWDGTKYTTIQSDTRFIYHGWNLVAEYAVPTLGTHTLGRRYTWGFDLSGTLAGDGGTGGLLMTQDGTSQYVYAYDGNGNVSAVMLRSTGATVAEYEYGAFGEPLRASNTYAQSNPFRYSTQYADNETGLLYYGYRYYDPQNGRFVGRDHIEEKGGLNLYAFCANNGVNQWDLLGNGDGDSAAIPVGDDGVPLDGPLRWMYEANKAAIFAQTAMMPGMYYQGFPPVAAASGPSGMPGLESSWVTLIGVATDSDTKESCGGTDAATKSKETANSGQTETKSNASNLTVAQFLDFKGTTAPTTTSTPNLTFNSSLDNPTGGNTFSVQANVSGTAFGFLAGVSGSVSVGLAIATNGNTYLQVGVGTSKLVGIGGALFASAGLAGGYSNGLPKIGYSGPVTSSTLQGAFGVGNVVNGEVDWDPSGFSVNPMTSLKPGLPTFGKPMLGAGFGAFLGVGQVTNRTITIPIPADPAPVRKNPYRGF